MSDQLSRGIPDQWKPENQDDDVKHYVDGMTGEKVSFEDFDNDNEPSDGGTTRPSKGVRKATPAAKSAPVQKESSDEPAKGDGK